MIRKGIICSEIPYMAHMKTERRNYMIYHKAGNQQLNGGFQGFDYKPNDV
jgi:hypothetical protein